VKLHLDGEETPKSDIWILIIRLEETLEEKNDSDYCEYSWFLYFD
jgi:hypothetical protein